MDLRLLVIGTSNTEICGVRSYASVLTSELSRLDVSVRTVWWEQDPSAGMARSTRDLGSWLRRIAAACREQDPHHILWHYASFPYGRRGVPVFVPAVATALSRAKRPAVVAIHEAAYPWGRRGWRGAVLAGTQRAALVPVVLVARGLVVTTERRRRWLASRHWLAERPLAEVPVFSTLPLAGSRPASADGEASPLVGIFGFGAEGQRFDVVASAVARLRDRGVDATVVMTGAPGPESSQADDWRRAFDAVGCPLRFTGLLSESDLVSHLESVDVFVSPDPAGPETRRTTIASLLALGKPVVALDGPERSDLLVSSGAVRLVQPEAGAVSDELERLLLDAEERVRQGDQARDLYRRELAPPAAAEKVTALLGSLPP